MLERTELVTLAKRMLAHYENGTTDQTDDIATVPVANYADPARWRDEVDGIFKRVPFHGWVDRLLAESGTDG
jgi:hypothetical protein